MCISSAVVGQLTTIISGSRKCIAGFCECRLVGENAWDTVEMEWMIWGGSFGSEGPKFNAVRELSRHLQEQVASRDGVGKYLTVFQR